MSRISLVLAGAGPALRGCQVIVLGFDPGQRFDAPRNLIQGRTDAATPRKSTSAPTGFGAWRPACPRRLRNSGGCPEPTFQTRLLRSGYSGWASPSWGD